MENVNSRRHITIGNKPDYENKCMFNFDVYLEPPRGQIPLKDLYKVVTDRFNVLQLVFKVAKENYRTPSKECGVLLIGELKKNHLDDYVTLMLDAGHRGDSDTYKRLRRNSQLAHFILKMALAFEEDKKQWFFDQEIRFFKWGMQFLDEDSIIAFKSANNLPYDLVSETEQQAVQEYLDTYNYKTASSSNTPYFKVHFAEALSLIRKQRVFAHRGNAFVPLSMLPTLFVNHFQDRLRLSFANARQAAATLFDEDRFHAIFQQVPECVPSNDFELDTWQNIDRSDLDELSANNFPLCMRVVHDLIRADHHLKNGARVQYVLFLKGIGLPLDETLSFFQEEFAKVMTEKVFKKKKYAYGIKHLYGKVGKEKNYPPHSCEKIIREDIGPLDKHGCPFKTMSPNSLKSKLHECGVSGENTEEILQLSEAGRCQAACSVVFNVTHECSDFAAIEHPNLYFARSVHQRRYNLF